MKFTLPLVVSLASLALANPQTVRNEVVHADAADVTVADTVTHVVTHTLNATAVIPTVAVETAVDTDVVVVPTVIETEYVTDVVDTAIVTRTTTVDDTATVVVTAGPSQTPVVYDDDARVRSGSDRIAIKAGIPMAVVGLAVAWMV
jgi:hypothetical protein